MVLVALLKAINVYTLRNRTNKILVKILIQMHILGLIIKYRYYITPNSLTQRWAQTHFKLFDCCKVGWKPYNQKVHKSLLVRFVCLLHELCYSSKGHYQINYIFVTQMMCFISVNFGNVNGSKEIPFKIKYFLWNKSERVSGINFFS